MLDFNETQEPARSDMDAGREEIRTALLSHLESVMFALFPAGKKRKGKFLIGDNLGSPGDSLEVVLTGDKAGLWTDRADGSGGDIFDLLAGHLALNVQTDFPRVLQGANDILGRAPVLPPNRSKREAPMDDLGPATAKWDYHDAEGKLIADGRVYHL